MPEIKISQDDERTLDETIECMELLARYMVEKFQYGNMTAANAFNWLLRLREQQKDENLHL